MGQVPPPMPRLDACMGFQPRKSTPLSQRVPPGTAKPITPKAEDPQESARIKAEHELEQFISGSRRELDKLFSCETNQ